MSVCITRNVNFVKKNNNKKQHLLMFIYVLVSNYDCISDKCLTDFPIIWPIILWLSPSEISNQHKNWKCVEDYLCTFRIRFSLIHLSCKTFYLFSPRVYVKLDPVVASILDEKQSKNYMDHHFTQVSFHMAHSFPK